MQCPKKDCGSPNVQLLPHYRKSLSPDSELYGVYAPPAGTEARVLPGFVLVVLGILMLTSGYPVGLAAVAAGGLWLYGVYKAAEDAARKREAWENARICLVCARTWTP